MNLNPQELGRRAEQMIRELAPISAEPDRLVRLFLRLSSLADPPSPARNGQPARDDGGKAG